MNENKIKHLEFIQNIIARKNSNSFTIKGWSVTLVAGIFALAANGSNHRFVIVAFVPVVMFAILDAYYLSYERRFRDCYNAVRIRDEKDIDFEIKMADKTWATGLFSAFFWSPNALFHCVLAILVECIGLYFNKA